MYLTAGLCNQWENQICSIKIQYFLFFPDLQTDPKYFCLPPKSQWNTKPKTNFIAVDLPFCELVPAGRDQKGLWSVLLGHNLSLQTEELAQGSWCLFWPSPRRVHVTSGYPEQGLPRSMGLLHPGEDSWLDQSRPLQKSKPWRKAPCAVGSSSWHCLDFVPCKHFTWPLLMTDALAGHG